MPDSILDTILAKLGCTKEDLAPIKKIAAISFRRVASELNSDLDHLSMWTKQSILSYAVAEWSYYIKIKNRNGSYLSDLNDENLINSLALLVSKKFLLITLTPASNDYHISHFSPIISTIEATLTKMDTINSKLALHDPTKSLIPDLFDRIIKSALGILKMMTLGLANDAYGSWRTLHEAECVIKLLLSGGVEVQNAYLKHIVYNNAFREAIPDKDATDQIFIQMKAEMKENDLKSKDMKKYIEYGWLYTTKEFNKDDPSYKLNFRDGVQKSAGLSRYSSWYEAASELSHSSPVFFYSSSEYFIELTTIGVYDVIERISIEYYKFIDPMGILSETDVREVKLLMLQLKEVAQEQRDYFTVKYKDAQLYDEEDI